MAIKSDGIMYVQTYMYLYVRKEGGRSSFKATACLVNLTSVVCKILEQISNERY